MQAERSYRLPLQLQFNRFRDIAEAVDMVDRIRVLLQTTIAAVVDDWNGCSQSILAMGSIRAIALGFRDSEREAGGCSLREIIWILGVR